MEWYISTDSNATGIIVSIPDQNDQDSDEYEETADSVDLIDDINGSEGSYISTDFQMMILFALGILIGVLLIGDRRF